MRTTQPATRDLNTRGIINSALRGGLGFAIAGAMCGLVNDPIAARGLQGNDVMKAYQLANVLQNIGFLILGGIGGGVLAWVSHKRPRVVVAAVAGSIGFGVAGLVEFGVDYSVFLPVFIDGIRGGSSAYLSLSFSYFISFAIRGAIGGTAIGLALVGFKKLRTVLIVAIAGALGFGIGGVLAFAIFAIPGIQIGIYMSSVAMSLFGEAAFRGVWLATVSFIGGAFLAVGLHEEPPYSRRATKRDRHRRPRPSRR